MRCSPASDCLPAEPLAKRPEHIPAPTSFSRHLHVHSRLHCVLRQVWCPDVGWCHSMLRNTISVGQHTSQRSKATAVLAQQPLLQFVDFGAADASSGTEGHCRRSLRLFFAHCYMAMRRNMAAAVFEWPVVSADLARGVSHSCAVGQIMRGGVKTLWAR